MQHRNNLLFAFAFLLVVFLVLIPSEWFSISSLGASNSGRTGSLGFPGTPKIPIWLLLGFSAVAVGAATLNFLRVTSIPRFVPALGLLVCGAYYALPLLISEDHFEVRLSAAPYVAVIATVVAFGFVLVPPSARPNNALQRTEAGGGAFSDLHA